MSDPASNNIVKHVLCEVLERLGSDTYNIVSRIQDLTVEDLYGMIQAHVRDMEALAARQARTGLSVRQLLAKLEARLDAVERWAEQEGMSPKSLRGEREGS